jgi:hypothetical protein
MHCCGFQRRRYRVNLYDKKHTCLVRCLEQAAFKSAELDIRAGMEPALHSDGRKHFSCHQERLEGNAGKKSRGLLGIPGCFEYFVEYYIFWAEITSVGNTCNFAFNRRDTAYHAGVV